MAAILSAILVMEEGTASSFAGFLAAFTSHGVPCGVYTDRGSHHVFTPKAAAGWNGAW